MAILSVKGLTKIFHKHTVVKDISFELPKGKCIALIGPNGAGKTTTLRMITNLIKPTAGEITFENNQADPRTLIGYLPQEPSFYPWMTGEEFLIYAGRLSHLSKEEASNRAIDLLKEVDIYEARNQRISQYSGGMKQRLGIAQALIHKPKLLILDEPVSALDPLGRRDVLTLMEQLKKEITIIFSTHILSDADEVSDELLLLHQGKLLESGSLELLRKKYQTAMIELEFEGNTEYYKEQIESLPSVSHCSITRNTLHASVTNIEEARKEILALTSDGNLPLTSYAINRTSLEDLFMKVVNGDAMDDLVSKRNP